MSLKKKITALLNTGRVLRGQMTMEAGISNIVMFAVLVITIGIAAVVLQGIQDGQTSGTAAYNTSAKGLSGLINAANLTPQAGTILMAAIILTLLVGGLGFFFARR